MHFHETRPSAGFFYVFPACCFTHFFKIVLYQEGAMSAPIAKLAQNSDEENMT
jgi:hypothetical protein